MPLLYPREAKKVPLIYVIHNEVFDVNDHYVNHNFLINYSNNNNNNNDF